MFAAGCAIGGGFAEVAEIGAVGTVFSEVGRPGGPVVAAGGGFGNASELGTSANAGGFGETTELTPFECNGVELAASKELISGSGAGTGSGGGAREMRGAVGRGETAANCRIMSGLL